MGTHVPHGPANARDRFRSPVQRPRRGTCPTRDLDVRADPAGDRPDVPPEQPPARERLRAQLPHEPAGRSALARAETGITASRLSRLFDELVGLVGLDDALAAARDE